MHGRQKWTMRGEYMESCNCDYLCPCIYTNPQGAATNDHCVAVMVFRIDEGSCGATPLAGLKFALVIRSGKVMADGNWVFAGVVDDAADPAQRQALAAIVGGDAGGPPGLHPAKSGRRFPRRRIQADPRFRRDRRPQPPRRDPRCRLVRDRGRLVAQPQRRALLHRQHRPSREPPAWHWRARPRTRVPRLWPRPRHPRRQRQ